MQDYYYKLKQVNNSDVKMSKLSKLIYAFVLLGAAALILILFENIIALSIYFVYIIIGVILGLSTILIIQLFSKNIDE